MTITFIISNLDTPGFHGLGFLQENRATIRGSHSQVKKDRHLTMKICAHCTTENRDEAIFCRHCRHPLRAPQTSEERSSRNFHIWLLAMVLLIGLSFYFFSPSPSLQSTIAQTSTPNLNEILTKDPAAAQAEEPITLSACVQDMTRIRRGPGTHFETIGGLPTGTCLTIIGRNDVASWAYIVSEDHQTGWVDVSLLNDSWGIDRVSIRDGSAMSNPGRATLTSEEIAYGSRASLTEIAATNIAQAPNTQYVMPCFETASRIGEHISCRIGRAVCDYLPALEGSPTVCNDQPYPNHNFTLIVFGKDWSEYDGECLIISGYLEIDKGVLQIQASQRSQVLYCN